MDTVRKLTSIGFDKRERLIYFCTVLSLLALISNLHLLPLIYAMYPIKSRIHDWLCGTVPICTHPALHTSWESQPPPQGTVFCPTPRQFLLSNVIFLGLKKKNFSPYTVRYQLKIYENNKKFKTWVLNQTIIKAGFVY